MQPLGGREMQALRLRSAPNATIRSATASCMGMQRVEASALGDVRDRRRAAGVWMHAPLERLGSSVPIPHFGKAQPSCAQADRLPPGRRSDTIDLPAYIAVGGYLGKPFAARQGGLCVRGRPVSLGGIIWIVVGVVVAATHHFFDNLGTIGAVLSALLAVLLWPLVLLGVKIAIVISGTKVGI